MSLAQQNDQPKSNSIKERMEEYVEKATEGLIEVSAGVCVKDLVVETSAEAGTEENNDASKGSVVPVGEQKPEKRHSAETDLANVTSLQNTVEESAMQTEKGACARDAPREGSETVAVKALDDTVVESLPETINVTNTAPEDEAVQQISVEQVPDLLADTVSKSPSQTADQTSAQGSSKEYPTAAGEAAKDEVKVVVASANEITTVTSPTREDGVPQTDSEEPISESPKSTEEDSAQGSSEGCPTGQLEAESAETETEVVAESSTDIPVVTDVGHGEVASCPDREKPTSDLQENSASESPTPAAAESNIEQCFVVAAEPVEAVDDVGVESSPEVPAVTDVALDGAVLQGNVEPGPDLSASCVSAPPAQFADETVTETVEAEAEVEFSPETPVVNNTTPEKDAGPVSLAEGESQSSVEPSAESNGVTNPSVVAVGEAEVVSEALVESPTKETSCLGTDSQANTHSASENCEKCSETTEAAVEVEIKSEAPQCCAEPGPESLAEVCHSRQVAGESAEVATAVAAVVESSPDMPAMTDVAPEDVSSQCIVEPEPDSAEPVSESHTESSAQDSNEGCQALHDGADTAESEVTISAVTDVAQTQEAFCKTDSVKTAPNLQPNTEESESPTQLASVVEVVEALAEALVPSLPMTPAEDNTVPGEGGGVQNSVEPGPDSQPEPVQPAAEMSKEDCPSGEVSSESVEAAAKGVVESSLQTSVVIEGAQQDASDIQTEDALVPKLSSDSVQSKLAERVIELTDALDEAPTTEAQCVKDSKQSSKGDSKVEQGPNDTNITKMLEKPEENQGPAETQTRDEEVCSLCSQTFGTVRIRISHPPLILHPDCFKCGVCGKDIGDLLTPMYLLKEVIHCEACHA
ncbi:flocculation protein FLO11 isoform X2 [Sphaeramia orbicularis]|nr:flocculation protein FLO11-like isoform X2 [Sphaeramia orbicularis]